MELKEKLRKIQQELKAPKQLPNKFGGYKYRNAEQILTAVKPLLEKYNVILTMSDEVVQVGDRYYVKATVIIEDVETETGYSVTAFARETLERKKYDDSQLTGAASSYARKYALGGLFLIDDEKDADEIADDDPEELDRQEAEEMERRPRKKRSEPEPDVADHDRYYYIPVNNNVVMVKAGVPVPEGGEEITELQYRAASLRIAKDGRKADVKKCIEDADVSNIPEDAPEEEPYMNEPEEEEKPKTRRTRRKRA